jgi:type II secretory ATPase GspE/PulE/Tfp pilus assembly ATPase PilB-like protein
MWQKFTEKARRAVFFAQEEAGRLHDGEVTTGHLSLGLMREDCCARQVLERLGIVPEVVTEEVRAVLKPKDIHPLREMMLSTRAKICIDRAYDEARALDNDYIGTEHLLLGVISEEIGAGRVLVRLGADLDRARAAVREMQPEVSESAGVIRIAFVILQQAILQKASDVLLEPAVSGPGLSIPDEEANRSFSACISEFEDAGARATDGQPGLRASLKVGDEWREIMMLPDYAREPVIQRIKKMAGIDPARTDEVQEGQIPVTLAGEDYVFNVSITPVAAGEKVSAQIQAL